TVAYSQNIEKKISSLEVSLLRDTLMLEGNAYAFNNIRVNNTGQISRSFNIDLDLPSDWSKIIDLQKLFTIQPGENLIIPFRIAASSLSQSDKSYRAILKFAMPAENISDTLAIVCLIKARTLWKMSLPNSNILKQVTGENAIFPVLLRNSGSAPEQISLNFNDNVGLNIQDILNVTVRPGSDTLLQVNIPADDRFQNAREVRIIVEASSKSKDKQSAEQLISALNSSLRANKTPWFNLPLTLEVVGQNAFTAGETFTLNGELNLGFKDERGVSINYQSESLYGARGGQSFIQAQYRSKGLNISAGDQTGFKNFQMIGYGARSTIPLRNKTQEIQISAIKSKRYRTSQFTYQHQFTTKKGSLSIENFGFFDPDKGINSYISELMLKRSLGTNTTIGFFQAGGFEDINQATFSDKRLSSRTALQINSKYKKISIRSSTDRASKYYPGFNKGLFTSTNDVSLLGEVQSLSAFANINYRGALPDSGVYVALLSLNSHEYGLKYGISRKTWSNFLTASYLGQTEAGADSVKSGTFRLGLAMNKRFGQSAFLNLAVNAGKISLPGLDSVKSTSFNSSGTFQRRNVGINARYEYGFSQLGDIYSYLQTGQIPERLNGNIFIENSLLKGSVQLRNQGDFNLNYSGNDKNFSLRSDIIFNLRKSYTQFKLSYLRTFNNIGSSNLNLSIRKNLNLPLPGIRKFETMDVVLFKDINADSVYNDGDEVLPDATIRINGKSFISDAKGRISYRNVSRGVYDIDLTMSAQKSWVPQSAFRQTVEVNKETNVFIPFKKTAFFIGKVILNRALNSTKTFSTANIKIMAVSSKGETFTTLTTENGSFSFSVPEDRYEVRIISSAFDTSFQIAESVLHTDLKNPLLMKPLEFIVTEQKRQINIRKAGP
uniref:COG1470 family protein n=1 Tax=Daejeonella sp. TaxID=2805397 RepID=UPI003983BD9F